MQREQRYVILKIKDIEQYLNDIEKDKLKAICNSINDGRAIDNKPELQAVVIENDWPEYEVAWRLIESRVDGIEIEF